MMSKLSYKFSKDKKACLVKHERSNNFMAVSVLFEKL